MQSEQTLPPDVAPALSLARTRLAWPLLGIRERKWLLAGGDAALVAGVLLAAYTAWHARVHPAASNMGHTPWTWILAGAVCWQIVSGLTGAYEMEVVDHLGRASRMVMVTWLAIGVLTLAAYYLFPKTYPRPALTLALVAAPLGVVLWRAAYASLCRRPAVTARVLVVGPGTFFQTLRDAAAGGLSCYSFVGYSSDGESGPWHLGSTEHLAALVRHWGIHRVVVAPRQPLSSALIATLTGCIEAGVEVVDFNSAYEEATSKVAVEHVGDQWLTALPTCPRTSLIAEVTMRCMDVMGAALGLAATGLLAPWIAAAVALDSGMPVLYRQERLGRGGVPFTIYKFRSMRQNAEQSGARWATPGDSRVTRVGYWLRRTHLDELPQFWNVLRGDMSLVGPRPERPSFTAELERTIPFYRLRLAVRPGLTGLKQIRVGYASSADEHLEVLRHDLYYIKHRSPGLNVAVIVRTLGSVLGMDGR